MANFAQAGIKFVAQGIDSFTNSIDKATSASKKFNASIQSTATNANKYVTQLGKTSGATDDTKEKVGLLAGSFTQLGTQADNLTNNLLPKLALGIGAVVLALGALVGAGISTAASFENAFADVTKTVDVFVDRAKTASEGTIALTEAGQEFRDSITELSTEIPVAFEELSKIAGLGGQLGVIEGLSGDEAQDSLLRFTETVAGLAEATNLTQEKAATGLAQISNIFRESVDDVGLNVERLGSVLVELGNTSAAIESLILNFSQRIAGAGQTVGLTQAEVFGIGTAFASIGITAEAGSTAVNRALLIMNEAVADSTDKFTDNTTAIKNTQEEILDLNADLVRLEAQTGVTGRSLTEQRDEWDLAGKAVEDFGRELGDTRRENLFQTQTEIDRLTQKLNTFRLTQGSALTTEVFDELLRVVQQTALGADQTAESFKELFRDDPAEAFALFVEGLAQEGDQAGATLDRIGLGSVEATRAFLAMAGASDLVRDRILAANEEFLRNASLTEEVSIRYATLKSNAEELWNALRALGDNVFGVLIPLLNPLVEWAKEVVTVFTEELKPVLEAFTNKIIPEIEGAFNQIFSGGGLFSGGKITTPEGFELSGDLIGARLADELFPGGEIETPEGFILSGDLIGIETGARFESLRQTLQGLKVDIEAADFSVIGDSIVNFWTTTSTIWSTFVENLDFIIAGVRTLTTVLGATFLISALKKAGEAVVFLSTPLGQVSLVVIGLSIAWQNNWLNIQQVTENVIANIKTSLMDFKTTLDNLDFGIDFSGLTGGDEQELDGVTISGELIGLDPTMLEQIGEAASMAAEGLGKLLTLIIDTPLDQVAGLVELIDGLGQVIVNLPSLIKPDPVLSLSGLIIDDRLKAQQKIREGLEQAVAGVIKSFTAPLVNLAELFDIEVDFSDLTKKISDKLMEASQSFFTGFSSQFGDEGTEGLGESVEGLFSAFSGLGDAGLVRVFTAGIRQIGIALGEFGEELKKLLDKVDGQKLIEIVGAVTGFLVSVSIDQLIAVIEVLTGLLTVLNGLLSLDTATVGQGFRDMGTALLEGFLAPLQRAGEVFDIDVRKQFIEPIPGLVSEVGAAFKKAWAIIIEDAKKAFDFSFEFPEIDTKPILQFFLNLDNAVLATVLDIQTKFVSMFTGKDILPPSFDLILAKVVEIRDKIVTFFKNMFDGVTIEFPDFGIEEKLIALGLIDAPETQDIAEGLAMGIVRGIEDEEDTWKEAWLKFLLSPIDTGKEALGIESPSTVTQAIGQDLILGYALGLSDLTPLEEALIGVNSSILSAFTALGTNMTENLQPSLDATDKMFVRLYSDTLPRTTSSIMDELIPAKEDLTEVNILDLLPSIEELIDGERRLEEQFKDTKDALDRLIDTKRDAKDKSKALVKEIDLLTEAYLALAEAIGKSNSAGTGVPTAPSAPGGPEFQSGGSFIVPPGVGPEGMPIRVHSGELVQIIPEFATKQMMSLPSSVAQNVTSPSISGATINNMVNTTSNSSEVKEFHLHVTESPSYNVRDSFELLETLN